MVFPKCIYCGNKVKKEGRKYCSRKCYYNHKSTDEWKTSSTAIITFKKISKALTGRKLSPEVVGKVRKASIGNSSTLGRRGKDANNWKGGVSKAYKTGYYSVEYKQWRMSVFERDDYTCQVCLKIGVHLASHHILNFAEHEALKYDVDNGITLCKDCHVNFHKHYGFRNNNKFQILEFIQEGGC